LKECRQGNEKAQLGFFRQFGDLALRTAWRYVKNEDDAREVMQLSMIKVFQNLHQFRGESGLETWVCRIVINQSLNYLRDQKRYALHVELSQGSGEDTEDILIDTETAPRDIYEALAVLNELPDVYRIIFNLFAIDGLTHQQIAETLGITQANSRQLLMRGRKMLKKELEKKISHFGNEQKTAY
jgi:RNA polymerase sigma factor (sigma-70 family)